jgi:uncharacterized membrane protein YpjA
MPSTEVSNTRRTSIAASLTAMLIIVLLLPVTGVVYDFTWMHNPAIADYVFFGLWAAAVILALFGAVRKEKRSFVAVSAIVVFSPCLFMMVG